MLKRYKRDMSEFVVNTVRLYRLALSLNRCSGIYVWVSYYLRNRNFIGLEADESYPICIKSLCVDEIMRTIPYKHTTNGLHSRIMTMATDSGPVLAQCSLRSHPCFLALWRHHMETFPASLAPCEGNPPVTGIPLTKASDVELWCFLWFSPENRLRKHSERRWFETPLRSLWLQCNGKCLWLSVISNHLYGPDFFLFEITEEILRYIKAIQMLICNWGAWSYKVACIFLIILKMAGDELNVFGNNKKQQKTTLIARGYSDFFYC